MIRNALIRLSPFALVISLGLAAPIASAVACDAKSCPHHKAAENCDCSSHKAGAKVKAHKCGEESCKKAKCDSKECHHEHKVNESGDQKS